MGDLEYNFYFRDSDLTLCDDLFDCSRYCQRNDLYLVGFGMSRLRLTMLSDETYDYNFGYNILANQASLRNPVLVKSKTFDGSSSNLETNLRETYLENLGFDGALKYNGFSKPVRFLLKWFDIERRIKKHLNSKECRHNVGNLIGTILDQRKYPEKNFGSDYSGSSKVICVDFKKCG